MIECATNILLNNEMVYLKTLNNNYQTQFDIPSFSSNDIAQFNG